MIGVKTFAVIIVRVRLSRRVSMTLFTRCGSNQRDDQTFMVPHDPHEIFLANRFL